MQARAMPIPMASLNIRKMSSLSGLPILLFLSVGILLGIMKPIYVLKRCSCPFDFMIKVLGKIDFVSRG